MIPIEQIQVGNLVSYLQVLHTIIERKVDTLVIQIAYQFYDIKPSLATHEVSSLELDPITLNKSWVVKAGFVIEKESEEENERIWHNGFSLHQSLYEEGQGKDEFSFATYVRGDGYLKGGISVETVHKLQNLYFGLEQKQMIFKN